MGWFLIFLVFAPVVALIFQSWRFNKTTREHPCDCGCCRKVRHQSDDTD